LPHTFSRTLTGAIQNRHHRTQSSIASYVRWLYVTFDFWTQLLRPFICSVLRH